MYAIRSYYDRRGHGWPWHGRGAHGSQAGDVRVRVAELWGAGKPGVAGAVGHGPAHSLLGGGVRPAPGRRHLGCGLCRLPLPEQGGGFARNNFV